jgi:hypothetical protein
MRCASLVVAVEVQAGQKQADINSRSRPFTTGQGTPELVVFGAGRLKALVGAS